MKIVDRKTFLAMPEGTLFSKYQPCVFDELMIKGESRIPMREGDTGDFWCQQIADAISSNSCSDFADKLFSAQENGESISMGFDCQGRDGLYDADQLFAVWEPRDVAQLIARLQEALSAVIAENSQDCGNGTNPETP